MSSRRQDEQIGRALRRLMGRGIPGATISIADIGCVYQAAMSFDEGPNIVTVRGDGRSTLYRALRALEGALDTGGGACTTVPRRVLDEHRARVERH